MQYVEQVAGNIVDELNKSASQNDLDTLEASVIENITTLGEIKP